jgi:hypothetical protein
MNRRNVTQLSVITSLALIFLPGLVFAQQKSLKEQLIGTWTYVSSSTQIRRVSNRIVGAPTRKASSYSKPMADMLS